MADGPSRLLGRGIYDTLEVARLVSRTPDEVDTWAGRTERGDALLHPTRRRLYSFYDLVTAKVTAELRARQVDMQGIRDARHYLAELLESDWPLANAIGLQRLASVGRSVYYDRTGEGDWVDAGKGGQAPFPLVAKPLIKRVEFDIENMAAAWQPSDGVLINPRIQAGAPCVEGTRVTTRLIVQLRLAGDSAEDIAYDYDLDLTSVREALSYEKVLAA